MKHVISVLALFVFMLIGLRLMPANAAGGGALIGDVNCDGLVDSRDARDVLRYDVGFISQLGCIGNANVDGYDGINTIDAILILEFHAGLIDHLPPIRTFTGTIVLYRGVEEDCLALDTGDSVYGLWNLDGAYQGDHVRVTGSLSDKISFICGVYPSIDNSSLEVIP